MPSLMGIITYKEKAMFIGSRYSLCDQEGRSSLGYGDITIKERVLSRTETRFKSTSAKASISAVFITIGFICENVLIIINSI